MTILCSVCKQNPVVYTNGQTTGECLVCYEQRLTGAKELKILCPFCNAPYTAGMKISLAAIASICDSVQDEIWGTIDIECQSCKRVVYRKEYDSTVDWI